MRYNLRIFTVITATLIPATTFAGGEYSEEELAQYTEKCNNATSGFACLVMAETTMCGVGFNERTAVWVNKACPAFEAACQKGAEAECIGLAHCYFKCNGYDFSSQILETVMDPTHLSCPLSTDDSPSKTHQINVDFLEGQCNKGMPKLCLLAGEYFMYGENSILSSDQLRNQKAIPSLTKACASENPNACALLNIAHQLEAQRLNKTVCEEGKFNKRNSYFKDLCHSLMGY